MDQRVWLRVAAVLIVCGVVVDLWHWIPTPEWDIEAISAGMARHGHAWYAWPVFVVAFIGHAVVPDVLLIAATGIAIGPILGPNYAVVGCLASGSVGFAIGRWLGRRRVERLGGERVARVTRTLN